RRRRGRPAPRRRDRWPGHSARHEGTQRERTLRSRDDRTLPRDRSTACPRPHPSVTLPTVNLPLGDPAAGRAAARLARTLENALADTGVSLPQYRTLVFLSEVGSSAASALAGKLGV